MNGNVGIGTWKPGKMLSNASMDVANAQGLSTNAHGIGWTLNGQGYIAGFSNTNSSGGNNNAGILVKLGSTDETDKILDLESGGVNRVRVLGTGNVGIGTYLPAATLNVKGSVALSTVAKTANYTATASDYAILVNTTTGGADVTITLPAAAAVPGRTYIIKKVDASVYNVIIDGNAAETIDGAATFTFNTQYQAITVVCDGTEWWII
jgi:hypothetical protein